jgi:hypothetical protein
VSGSVKAETSNRKDGGVRTEEGDGDSEREREYSLGRRRKTFLPLEVPRQESLCFLIKASLGKVDLS